MLKTGVDIVGKWKGGLFRIEQVLGQGANGTVYLVGTPRGKAAMKVCTHAADIAMEWSLLGKLSPVSGAFPKPMLIDDYEPDLYFYVMEWVPGTPLQQALAQLSPADTRAAIAAVLQGLVDLHRNRLAFCDIKPENILITAQYGKVGSRFVDVGGVTPFGRAVRQYTPFYDRAFWGLGSRKADAAYDICGLAVALVTAEQKPPPVLYSQPPEERRMWLQRAIAKSSSLPFMPILEDVLSGRVTDAQTFLQQWQQAPLRQENRGGKASNRSSQHRASITTGTGVATAQVGPRRKKQDWTEWLMWASLCTAATVTLSAWVSFLGWF